MTSGCFSASQFASGAKFSKIGAQTGSSRLFLSNAKPIVGVCEAAMPPIIRAMPVLLQRVASVRSFLRNGCVIPAHCGRIGRPPERRRLSGRKVALGGEHQKGGLTAYIDENVRRFGVAERVLQQRVSLQRPVQQGIGGAGQ